MNCSHHPQNEIIGYCSVCGNFGCSECLTVHDGSLYCRKHYRPFAQQLEEEKKREEHRKKPTRQRLVVRYADGRVDYGVCFALNPKDRGFHLDRVTQDGAALGEAVDVRFSDLKAVFYVKSFDGKFDKSLRYKEWIPEGKELVVEFKDGEVIRGTALRSYDMEEPRFYLIPEDPKSNNISLLIEGHAIEGLYTPEEHKAKRQQEKEERKKRRVATDLSQEETMGDFYFETRNYVAALEQYELAAKKVEHSHRLWKKTVYTRYNIGVQHVKHREYSQALACMQAVLKADPDNAHAKKKVVQLRRIIDKMARAASEESEKSARE